MKNRICLYIRILSIMLCLTDYSLTAQPIIAKQMPFLEQLPSNEILNLHQDKDGFIWLGTKNGLGRYDGYQLQSFRSDFNQPHLLTDNFIWCFAEDDNSLLLGTRHGVNILNKKNYQIKPFPHKEVGSIWINDVFVDRKKVIWVATSSHLYQFHPDYSLKKCFDNSPSNPPGSGINSITEDNYGNLWVCTWGKGLYKYDRETDSFVHYPRIGKNNVVYKIFQDKNNQYWLLTWGEGIFSFHPNADSPDKMYTQQAIINEKLNIPEVAFFSIVQDDVYDYIWVFGYHKLYAFKAEGGHLKKINISSYMLDYNKMFSQIIKDREGNLWAGAYDSGYHILMGSPYITNNSLAKLKNVVGFDANITTLCADPVDGLWFCQERWGLCRYDVQHDKIYDYSTREIGLNNIGYILRSKRKNELWIGGRDTPVFYKVKLNNNKDLEFLFRKNLNDKEFKTGLITAMYEDSKANLWVATTGQFYIKPLSGELIKPGFTLSDISSIAEDNSGNIWMGSQQSGLYKVSFAKGITLNKHYSTRNSTLLSDNIEGIISRMNTLWIYTTQGSVITFNTLTQEFKDMSRACGMTGDPILGMKCDGNILWILTNRQITAYDIHADKYLHYSNSDESIQINSFKKNVIDVYNGRLFAGGHGGFVSMPSLQLPIKNKRLSPVVVTDVKVSNHSLFFNPVRESKNASTTHIRLNPDDRDVEIFFSALQYTSTSQIRYAYKMKGVDRDWVYLEAGRRSAFYNKIPKGDHPFMVRSTDEYGYWRGHITTLLVYKVPAWHETWWAYTAYVIMIMLAAYLIIYYYLRRTRLADQLKLQKELTKTKLEYFTNISHELLTPLSTISCVAEDLERGEQFPEEDVRILKSNVQRLKRLIQQVLDFRKIEKESFVLNPTYGNITDLIREICNTGIRPIINQKNITLEIHLGENPIWGYLDFDKVDKILYNILSNASKFTPANKKITLNALTVMDQHGIQYLKIEVADEGIGIEKSQLNKIFQPFYMNKTAFASLSNGIGLSLSKKLVSLHKGSIDVRSVVGQGSVFTIQIPIQRSCYPEIMDIVDTQPEVLTLEQPSINYVHEGTILFVDDNTEFLLLMRKMLQSQYRVLAVTNGMEALEKISNEDIDVVVADFMMPEMNGCELCETVKKDIRNSHIPVLILTAKNSLEDEVACYNAGADGYLMKPFELKMLYARIDNLIKLNKKRQQQFRNDTKINVMTLEYKTLDEQFLQDSIQCIEKHLIETEFDIDLFSLELNVSKSTLNRKIKAMTGLAPVEFIRNIRLKHACLLLKKPFVNISEVAYTVGFSNPRYFAKCFKDEFGISPREYQNNQ